MPFHPIYRTSLGTLLPVSGKAEVLIAEEEDSIDFFYSPPPWRHGLVVIELTQGEESMIETAHYVIDPLKHKYFLSSPYPIRWLFIPQGKKLSGAEDHQ